MQEIKIGRNLDNDIIFENDLSVSRIHASIIINGNSKFIIDHNSGNGTFVNGNRITGQTILKNNDIVKVGNSLVPWMSKLNNQQKTVAYPNEPKIINHNTVSNVEKITLPGSGAALTLGILSIVFVGGIGVILGIIGIVQANKGEKLLMQNPERYTAKSVSQIKSGKVCSIIGLSLFGVMILLLILSEM